MSDIALSVTAGLVTFAISFWLFSKISERKIIQNKNKVSAIISSYSPNEVGEDQDKNQNEKKSWIDAFGALIISESYQRRMRSRLVSIGKQDINSYRALVRRKIFGTLFGLTYGLLTQLDGSLKGLLTLALATVAGFFLPDVLTYNSGTKRSMELDRSLPDAIDILNLCVESGLTFQASMAQVSSILKGPIADEFSRVLRQMQLGQSLIASLQDLAARNNNDDLSRFVSVIIQADKLGIPISAVLHEQAREMRGKRRERAREQAQKVPVKILMPVMLCFLPGIFVVILGPAVVSIVRAFSSM